MKILNYDIAYNGQEALEKFISAHHNGRPYDLITLDVEMPIMNGKTAAEKMR